MIAPSRWLALVAMIMALSGVIFAALGSHAVEMNGLESSWNIATSMHLFSAAAAIGLSAWLRLRPSKILSLGAWLVVAGSLLFCSSIYFHVTTGTRIPSVTPFGGGLMMIGWLLAAVAFIRKS